MGIDTATFWVITKSFIDNIGTLSIGGVFINAYKEICYLELQVKVEHSDIHAPCHVRKIRHQCERWSVRL